MTRILANYGRFTVRCTVVVGKGAAVERSVAKERTVELDGWMEYEPHTITFIVALLVAFVSPSSSTTVEVEVIPATNDTMVVLAGLSIVPGVEGSVMGSATPKR